DASARTEMSAVRRSAVRGRSSWRVSTGVWSCSLRPDMRIGMRTAPLVMVVDAASRARTGTAGSCRGTSEESRGTIGRHMRWRGASCLERRERSCPPLASVRVRRPSRRRQLNGTFASACRTSSSSTAVTPISSAHLPGLAVFASSHSGGSVMPWHTHDAATVCCVMNGAFTEYWRGHALECSTATVKVTPAGEPHWNRFGEAETLGLMVEVQPQVYARSRPIERVLDSLVHVNGGELAFIARRIWRELDARDAAAPLALEGL